MSQDPRTYKIGKLTELKQQRETLRIEIDAMAKAIVLHFEPMDQDMIYTDKICPERLRTYISSIERKKKILDHVNTEIHSIAAEIGEPE
jgi:hypothetical protein